MILQTSKLRKSIEDNKKPLMWSSPIHTSHDWQIASKRRGAYVKDPCNPRPATAEDIKYVQEQLAAVASDPNQIMGPPPICCCCCGSANVEKDGDRCVNCALSTPIKSCYTTTVTEVIWILAHVIGYGY